MRASSSRFARMSSARTPTRAGLHVMLGDQQLAYKSGCGLLHHWPATGLLTQFLFAAPMVDAPPDNIGAQRLAEGGLPASEAGSAQRDVQHSGAGSATMSAQKNWNLTPIKK